MTQPTVVLIRGTEEDSDDSDDNVQLFLVPAHPGYPRLKGRKTVVVVVVEYSCVMKY